LTIVSGGAKIAECAFLDKTFDDFKGGGQSVMAL